MSRCTYTPQQKANALELYATHGLEHAHHHTGIPAGTIKSWASRTAADATGTSVATRLTENREARVQALKAKWAERRLVMVQEIGAVAHMALAQAEAAVAAGSGKDAKDFATTMAILVDKAQLLDGGATSRTEVTERAPEVDAELARVLQLRRSA